MTISRYFLFVSSLTLACAGSTRTSAVELTVPPGEPSSPGQPSVSNGVTKLTLNAALTEAFTNSPAVRVIEADIDAARGEVITAQIRPNPELTFSPGFRRLRGDNGANHEFIGAFDYSQVFVFAGRRELLISIAERNVELRRLGIDGLRFQVAAAVRRSFYELLAAESILGLREQQLESARTFQQAAARRAESGYASDFEAVKSQGEVINAQKLLRVAEGDITSARVELNSLLGRDPSGPLDVAGSLEGTYDERRIPELLALAYERNPSIRVQEMQAEIAGLNLRKAKLTRKPDFSVGPSVSLSKSEQIVGLSATVSLPRKSVGRGEIMTATAEQRKAIAEMERLRREIAGAVTKSATQLATANSLLRLYSKEYLNQLKAVVEQAEQSYAQNATSLLIYLDAKRTYFDTLASYYEAVGDAATSRAELESAVGVPLEPIPSSTSNP